MTSTPQTLLDEGYQARRDGRSADARTHFGAALETAREAGDRALVARSLAGLGQAERDLGNLDAARKHYQDAAGFYRALGEHLSLAHAMRHAGDILRKLKKTDQAGSYYTEALGIYRENHETPPLDLANTLRGYALLKGDLGEDEESTMLWLEAKHLYEQAGVQAGVSECESHLAFLLGR